jgi:hypothetical protein
VTSAVAPHTTLIWRRQAIGLRPVAASSTATSWDRDTWTSSASKLGVHGLASRKRNSPTSVTAWPRVTPREGAGLRLSRRQRSISRSHARIRGIGERTVAMLKGWKILTKPSYSSMGRPWWSGRGTNCDAFAPHRASSRTCPGSAAPNEQGQTGRAASGHNRAEHHSSGRQPALSAAPRPSI